MKENKKTKRVFGIFEVVFDALYLITALVLAFILFFTRPSNDVRLISGIMALILVCGDTFHLIPRIMVIITYQEERLRPALGLGKQITSITMTVFYLFLWQMGQLIFTPAGNSFWSSLVYLLAAARILLCLLPQNKWKERFPPISWGIWRNIPFFLLGAAVAVLFFLHRSMAVGLGCMWLAIVLSFACYLPVVLWSNRNPKIGMLMLPKTCAYLWMLIMCLSL